MHLVFVASLVLCAPSGASRVDTYATRDAFVLGKHRGMSYAHAWGLLWDRGYGSEDSSKSLRALRELGVNWISITPFGFQAEPHASGFRWRDADESDDRLRAVTQQAHRLGMKVMLKPHLWLRPPFWPGSVEPQEWEPWFACYRAFITHYAELASRVGMDVLCVGNELEKTSQHEKEWRETIREIRQLYDGPLTYGAGMDEVFGVPFWDALDFIGVSAYYPLVDARSPDRAALAAGWGPVATRLAALSARSGRKIVFTELGYRSADFGAWRQWEVAKDAPINLGLQANAYEAFFDTIWQEPWFGGVYFWKWFSYLHHSGPGSNGWELEDKPAEDVLKRRYRTTE